MMMVRNARKKLGVTPSFKRVDTCAAEFEAATPYMYSCYDGDDECAPTKERKVLILGGGPNRIGQGIEFDYCCCHASYSLRWGGAEEGCCCRGRSWGVGSRRAMQVRISWIEGCLTVRDIATRV